MKISYYSITDKGKTREHNEDYFLNNQERGLFVVADGMGGYECGDLASKMALNNLIYYYDHYTSGENTFSKETLNYAVQYSNLTIKHHQKSDPKVKKMGTTLVGFIPSDQGGMAVHVGDSRLYRFRSGHLEQITRDHSAEAEVLPDFMAGGGGKYSSVITRALGVDETVKPEFSPFDCKEEDLILLCSDGLYSMVEPTQIAKILADQTPLSSKGTSLINAANDGGGEDNITATIIKIESFTGSYELTSECLGEDGR